MKPIWAGTPWYVASIGKPGDRRIATPSDDPVMAGPPLSNQPGCVGSRTDVRGSDESTTLEQRRGVSIAGTRMARYAHSMRSYARSEDFPESSVVFSHWCYAHWRGGLGSLRLLAGRGGTCRASDRAVRVRTVRAGACDDPHADGQSYLGTQIISFLDVTTFVDVAYSGMWNRSADTDSWLNFGMRMIDVVMENGRTVSLRATLTPRRVCVRLVNELNARLPR